TATAADASSPSLQSPRLSAAHPLPNPTMLAGTLDEPIRFSCNNCISIRRTTSPAVTRKFQSEPPAKLHREPIMKFPSDFDDSENIASLRKLCSVLNVTLVSVAKLITTAIQIAAQQRSSTSFPERLS